MYEPYNVTASCLDPVAKKFVKKQVLHLGGHLVNDWRKDCLLVVMNSLSATVKVRGYHKNKVDVRNVLNQRLKNMPRSLGDVFRKVAKWALTKPGA